MPELPEVEAVRRELAKFLPGRAITDVRTSGLALRRDVDQETLALALVGGTFGEPQRNAKFLLIPVVERGGEVGTLLAHLGMTGRFTVYREEPEDAEAHTHLRLALDDGKAVHYVDPRRFGFIDWLPPGARDESVDRLGLDPLATDFVDRVAPLLKARKAGIKTLLMNQSVIGGVGNIYAIEALFRAGIHPTRPGARIGMKRLRALAEHVQDVLNESIANNGTTIKDYVRPGGGSGEFIDQLQAYGHQGEACPRCRKETLRAMQIAGRITVYCPKCQR